MRKKIFRLSIVIVVAIVICTFVWLFNRSTQGIPHGVYFQLDSEEQIIKDGLESGWHISHNKAEHRYQIFSIVKIDGKVYFEIEQTQKDGYLEQESSLFRYEAKYDKKTKILTVSMSSNDGYPSVIQTNAYEMASFRFVKSGFSIG